LRIELRLYASFKKYLPGDAPDNPCWVEMEEGATVRKLFEKCQIPFDVPKIIFLNGVHAWGDEGLKDGDRVGAFPPVAGG